MSLLLFARRLTLMGSFVLPSVLFSSAIREIAPFVDFVAGDSEVQAITGFTYHEGTFYVALRGEGPSQINSVQLGSEPVNLADETDFTSGFPIVQYGFGINASGDLQFADSRRSDEIYRLTTEGQLTTLVSNEQLSAYIHSRGVPTTRVASPLEGNRIRPQTDEFYVFEFWSEEILKIDPTGGISTLLTQPQLINLTGTDRVDGGIAFSLDGTMLYWVSRRAKAFYAWDIDQQAGSKLLDTVDFHTLIGSSDDAIIMRDLFMAPDGFLYFSEGITDYIYRFDPEAPVTSLEVVVTKQELIDATGSDLVGQLGWYNGGLAFIIEPSFGDPSRGIYSITPIPRIPVTSVSRTGDGSMVIEFASKAGETYAASQSATLQDDWVPVPGFENITGTGGSQTVTLPAIPVGDTRLFYRIRTTD